METTLKIVGGILIIGGTIAVGIYIGGPAIAGTVLSQFAAKGLSAMLIGAGTSALIEGGIGAVKGGADGFYNGAKAGAAGGFVSSGMLYLAGPALGPSAGAMLGESNVLKNFMKHIFVGGSSAMVDGCVSGGKDEAYERAKYGALSGSFFAGLGGIATNFIMDFSLLNEVKHKTTCYAGG